MELLIPILIILIGFVLIVAEVYFIPGFNVVGVMGFLLIVFSVGYVFIEQGTLGGVLAGLGSIVLGGSIFYILWTTGAWNRFILATSLRHDEQSVAQEHEYRSSYLGKTGTALTPLRPTGVIEIDSERLEVVTEGEFIAAGSTVRVVAMDRRRYFVRLENQPPLPPIA